MAVDGLSSTAAALQSERNAGWKERSEAQAPWQEGSGPREQTRRWKRVGDEEDEGAPSEVAGSETFAGTLRAEFEALSTAQYQ
eukprot:1853687-Rhodomonas_salina.3